MLKCVEIHPDDTMAVQLLGTCQSCFGGFLENKISKNISALEKKVLCQTYSAEEKKAIDKLVSLMRDPATKKAVIGMLDTITMLISVDPKRKVGQRYRLRKKRSNTSNR